MRNTHETVRPFVHALRATSAAALIALGALACFGAQGARAAEINWSTKPVAYAIQQPKDVRAVIRELAAQQGMGVSIDAEVKGELAPGTYTLNPRAMLELVARNLGLIWYYDGRVLYVYPSTSIETAFVRLAAATPSQFQRSLDRLGISDSRYPLSFDGDRVLVSGPKRYVEAVKQAAADMDNNGNDPNSAVRVFELKYAFADDYAVASGGKEYRVPGVVSILRQLVERNQRSLGGNGRRGAFTPRQPLEGSRAARGDAAGGLYAGDGALPTLPALDGANGRQTRNGRNGGNSGNGADSGADPLLDGLGSTGNTVFGGSGGVTASFAADPRTNSVIVRDAPARMEQYEAIIRRLDQKPRLVELEVNIVEVNADDFSELGIDWRALGRRGSIEVGGGGIANPVTQPPNANPQPGNDPIASLGNIAGTVIGVVSGTRNQLFARITALEQAGKATMSAQPKVMTLNNVEAALSATSTFFVPVQGFQDAQLYDISAGTSLRITPSVVAGTTASGAPGRDNVRMRIAIEDGSLTNTKVNQLPVVQNTQVNTQSLVTDGSTLLIAGYAQERESRTQNGVPVLQHVPVLGNLFKSSDRNRTRVERLFMITPRVVDVQVAEAARDVPMLPNVQPAPPGAAPAAPAVVQPTNGARGALPANPPAPGAATAPRADVAPPGAPLATPPPPAPMNLPAPAPVPAPAPAPAHVVLTTAAPPQPPVAAAAPTAADEQAAARRSAWALGLTAAPPTRSAPAPAPAPASARAPAPAASASASASAVPAGNAPAGSLWLTPAPSATKR